jgi:hypothetical protein
MDAGGNSAWLRVLSAGANGAPVPFSTASFKLLRLPSQLLIKEAVTL